MSVAHVDEVLRQRNQYREELAAVRQERDSQHGLATSLKNRNDHLESDNVDLRTKIADLHAQIAKLSETNQQPALPSGPAIVLDDDVKEAVSPALSTKSVERNGAAKSTTIADDKDLKPKKQPSFITTKRRRLDTTHDLPDQQDSKMALRKRVKVQDDNGDIKPLATPTNVSTLHSVSRQHFARASSSKLSSIPATDDESANESENDGIGGSDSSPDTPSASSQNHGQNFKVRNKEAFILPQERIDHHLNGCRALTIVPSPLPTSISRACLLKHYGTNTQQFIGTVKYTGKARAAVFAQPGQNPFLPRCPGARGLLFASRHEVLKGIHMLFVKLERQSSKETPLWEYRGDFESILSAKMTPAEFNMQRDDVKIKWANHLLSKVKWDCYTSMRARIYLQKQGLLPYDKKSQTAAVEQEMNRIRKRQGGKLSAEDVIAALARGDEGIDIITMKCVKYDHEFAQDLRNKSTGGVVSQTKAKNTKKRVYVQDSDSAPDFDSVELDLPNGSSSGIRRSARQSHPRVIAS
ncbi:hypothetical protein PILCRDRAFT_816517 [Piloderma croceum F 1598]|uniref:DUF6697 domain-containing protein n=1 Tax=Piloderma croceum (strain F 1598) TaxID=765440 RepID=A0A0C3C8D3_PILCF|nr:hypothetical protein PILCRDRAFT_816517 [Piloderma croceum F 1598]